MLTSGAAAKIPGRSLALLLALGAMAWLAPASGAWAASFMISPNKFEFPLQQRYTNFFTVTNTSTEVTSIRIYAQAVALDDSGQVANRSGAPGDMTGWVVINPRRITLGPQEKRVVRFSVRAPESPAAGEYNTFLFFEELPHPPAEGAAPSTTGARLDLLTRIGAALWGQAGQLDFRVALDPGTAAWPHERLEYSGSIKAEGNAHVVLSVSADLSDRDGKSVRTWEGTLVLFRGDVRHLKFDWKRPPPGEYTLQVSVKGDQVPPVNTQTPVVVPRAEGN